MKVENAILLYQLALMKRESTLGHRVNAGSHTVIDMIYGRLWISKAGLKQKQTSFLTIWNTWRNPHCWWLYPENTTRLCAAVYSASVTIMTPKNGEPRLSFAPWKPALGQITGDGRTSMSYYLSRNRHHPNFHVTPGCELKALYVLCRLFKENG